MAAEKTIILPREGENAAEIKTRKGKALTRLVGGENPARPVVADVDDAVVVREEEVERLARSGAVEFDDKTLKELGIEL